MRAISLNDPCVKNPFAKHKCVWKRKAGRFLHQFKSKVKTSLDLSTRGVVRQQFHKITAVLRNDVIRRIGKVVVCIKKKLIWLCNRYLG